MTRKYMAIYEHRADGYSGYLPDLPGCRIRGANLDDVRRQLRAAVDKYAENLHSRLEKLPESVSWVLDCPPPSEGHGINHWVVEGVEVPTFDAG